MEVFSFDETGNWQGFDSTSMPPGPLSLTHNAANEITAISASAYPVVQPVFDPCGNMTVTPTPSTWGAQFDLKWDAWNRMVETSQGVDWVNRYTYDALSRRQTYSQSGWVSNICVYYYNLQWRPVQELRDGCSELKMIAKINFLYVAAAVLLFSLDEKNEYTPLFFLVCVLLLFAGLSGIEENTARITEGLFRPCLYR